MVTMRNTAIIALLFLVGACVRVGNIQQTEPIRTMNFTGSHKTMAQCVQQRLGGQVRDESFGNRYVIYDSVKGSQSQDGFSHYSITVAQTGPDQGTVSWRVVIPSDELAHAQRVTPGGGRIAGGLPNSAVQKYWTPVEDCAAQAKSAK